MQLANGPSIVRRAAAATLAVPSGFGVEAFSTGLEGPRRVRIAPTGDNGARTSNRTF
jgi:hypothetical protein